MSKIGCRIAMDFERPDPALVAAFRTLPAANIDDCMNRLFAVHQSIKPVGRGGMAGPAFTIKMPQGDNLLLHQAMDMARPGDVVVIDTCGTTDRAIFGELMASYMSSRKVAGVAVDGPIRDSAAMAELSMPVYSRGVSPNGPYKNGPGEINFPVSLGGQVVLPGDLVVGDDDGLVVIRRDEAAELLEEVRTISLQEAGTIKGIMKHGRFDRPWVEGKVREAGFEMLPFAGRP